MSSILLAFRISWIFILIVMGAAFVVWLFLRAGVDLLTWFREEILEDFRDRKRRKQ